MQNITIEHKEAKTKKESNKDNVVLAQTRANLYAGLDKGGEYGVGIGWKRMSQVDPSITNLKEYLTALAKDIAEVARKM